ncbi:MAG: PAS domain-containing protein [Bacteroidota bacterium]|nr:PAS domain-containing protein [Bacteroidota bacterium]
MNIAKYTPRLSQITGSPYFVPFEHRVFNLFTFLMVLFMPIISITNFFIGLNFLTIIFPIPFFFIFAYFHYLTRYKNFYKQLLIPVFLLCYISICSFWFISGGLTGSIPAYFLITMFVFIMSGDKAWQPLILTLFFISGMSYLEYLHPEWLMAYESSKEKLLDALSGHLLVIFILYVGILYFKKEKINEIKFSDEQRKKAELRIEKIYKILREEEKTGLSLMRKILKAACDMLEMEVAFVNKYEPESNDFVIHEIYSTDKNFTKGQKFNFNDSFGKYSFQKDDVVFINDVSKLTNADKLFFNSFNINTLVSVPVWNVGEKHSTLVFLSKNSVELALDQGDKDFMFFITQWIAYISDKNNYEAQILYKNHELEELNEKMTTLLMQLGDSQQEIKKLALVANETDNFVFILDKNVKIEWVNKAFTEFTGYSLDEVIGKVPADVLNGIDTDIEHIAKVLDGLASKKPFNQSIKNYTKFGEPYWVDSHITPIINSEGELEQYIVIEHEISDRIREQEESINRNLLLTALSQSQHELLNNSNILSAIQIALERIGTVCKVHRSYYFETFFHPQTHKMVASQKVEWNSGIAPSQLFNPANELIIMENYPDFFEPLIMNKFFEANIENYTPKMNQILLEDQQIRSILLIPIFVNGHMRGYIGFDDCLEARIWTESEKAILNLFAENISAALLRMESEKLNRDLSYAAQNSKNGVVILTLEGKVEWVNNGFTELTGYSSDLLVSESQILEKISPSIESNQQEKKYIINSMQEQLPFSCEFLIKTFKGDLKWILIEGRPIFDEEKGVVKYIAEQVDITQRKQAEQFIKEQNKQFVEIAYVQSHEFKGPLARIRGLLFLIEQEHVSDKKVLELLAKINHSAFELNQALSKVVEKANQYDNYLHLN